jgi:hypothetical protein
MITRGQKASMFIGATACGASSLGVFTVSFFSDQARNARTVDDVDFFAVFGAVVVSNAAVAMVFGAWVGGLVSFVWRSQQGRRIFWRLSGGVVGAILAAEAAAIIISRGQPWLPLRRSSGELTEAFLMGCIDLAGTLLGLLIGHAIAAHWGHRDL